MSINQEKLNQLREQALNLQASVVGIQAQMAATEVTGTATGGQVSVTMNAAGDFLSVYVDPDLLEDCPAHEVEAVFLAALQDASAQLKEFGAQRTASISSVLDNLQMP
jgi:nucleoid-associated protein EbfC